MFEYDYTTIHSFGNSDDVNANEPFVGIQNKDAGRLERRALLETLQQHVIKFTVPLRTDLSLEQSLNFTYLNLNLDQTTTSLIG